MRWFDSIEPNTVWMFEVWRCQSRQLKQQHKGALAPCLKDLSDSRAHQDITYPSLERRVPEMQDYLIASVGCCPELLCASGCNGIGWFRTNHVEQKHGGPERCG